MQRHKPVLVIATGARGGNTACMGSLSTVNIAELRDVPVLIQSNTISIITEGAPIIGAPSAFHFDTSIPE